MATRTDICTAFEAADRHLAALTPALLAAHERPLRQRSRTVRDALCHLTARTNGVALALSCVDAPPSTEQPPDALEIDEVNCCQIAACRGCTIPALLAEIAAGHLAALAQLARLDDTQLARPLASPFLPSAATVADLILLAGPGHEATHLATIVEALDVAGAP